MKKFGYVVAFITFIIFWIIRFNFEGETLQRFDAKMSELLFGKQWIVMFHQIGDTGFVVTVAFLLLLFLWLRERNYRAMLFVVLTFGAGNVLNQLLKIWVQRPRPDIVDQLTSYSYPSGHTMTGFLYLCTIAYLLSGMIVSQRKILVVWIVTLVLVFFVGISRIAEARHYATDVLGGWLMGYTWLMVCIYWYEGRKRILDEIQETHLEK